MPTNKTNISKLISFVTLIMIAVSFLWHLADSARFPNQLVSPLIPKSIIEKILRDNMIITLVLCLGFFIALIFHKWDKYIISIALCIFTFILIQYFPELIL
jgi:hypothetical protein